MRRRALGALLCVLATAAGAQDRERCTFSGARQTSIETSTGQRNTYFGGGFVLRCPKSNLRLSSDSAETFGDEGRYYFRGNVHYDEPRLTLTSDNLTYRQPTEHIFASGNVVTTSPKSGSTLRGPAVEYFRATNERPVARMHAVQRPTVHLIQKDSSGRPADTLVVVSDRLDMIGDSLVYAGGKVVMTRPDLEAKGDSMMLDADAEKMVLLKEPSITGNKDRPFTLTGVRIESSSKERKLDRVLAMGNGKALSDDMTLTADTIDLRVTDNLLQRAIAHGPGKARITSSTQQISSDSIDVLMPNQKIRELHAVRGAVAVAPPDTTRFKTQGADSLRGDTIIAKFDSALAKDTVKSAQLKQLLARGSAKSYYHLAPSDTTLDSAAVNYVMGKDISVDFAQSKMSRVTVKERVAGVFIDPLPKPKGATKTAPSTKTAPAGSTKTTPPATTKTPPKPAP